MNSRRHNHLYIRSLLAFLFVLCPAISVIFAQGGYEFENFGNRSVLLNGNVTGSVDDLGAVYYNPARLALIKNPGFLVEGKFYEWTKVSISDVVPDERFNTSNFTGLPGMLAGSVKLLGTTFYYSSISRNRFKFDLNYNSGIIDTEDSDLISPGNRLNVKVGLNNNLREDWFGLTWAYKVSDRFALGTSLFAASYKYSGGDQFRLTGASTGNVEIYESNLRFSNESYGLYLKVAAAWIFDSWELGINIDLPYLEIFQDASFRFDEILAIDESGGDVFVLDDFTGLDSQYKVPLGINIGAGIPIKKHKLHLNLSYYASVSDYDRIQIPELNSETGEAAVLVFKENRRAIVNAGFGGEFDLSEKFNGYLSFSTDFSPFKEADEVLGSESGIGTSNLLAFDNYHFGGGLNFKFRSIDVVLGAIHSFGNEDFRSVRDRPSVILVPGEDTFNIKISRWRFLLGLNISFRDLLKVTEKKE